MPLPAQKPTKKRNGRALGALRTIGSAVPSIVDFAYNVTGADKIPGLNTIRSQSRTWIMQAGRLMRMMNTSTKNEEAETRKEEQEKKKRKGEEKKHRDAETKQESKEIPKQTQQTPHSNLTARQLDQLPIKAPVDQTESIALKEKEDKEAKLKEEEFKKIDEHHQETMAKLTERNELFKSLEGGISSVFAEATGLKKIPLLSKSFDYFIDKGNQKRLANQLKQRTKEEEERREHEKELVEGRFTKEKKVDDERANKQLDASNNQSSLIKELLAVNHKQLGEIYRLNGDDNSPFKRISDSDVIEGEFDDLTETSEKTLDTNKKILTATEDNLSHSKQLATTEQLRLNKEEKLERHAAAVERARALNDKNREVLFQRLVDDVSFIRNNMGITTTTKPDDKRSGSLLRDLLTAKGIAAIAKTALAFIIGKLALVGALVFKKLPLMLLKLVPMIFKGALMLKLLIPALIAGLGVYIWKNWDEITEWFKNTWSKITEWWADFKFTDLVPEWLQDSKFGDWINDKWEYSLESLSTAGSWIRDRWSNVTTNFSTAGDWIKDKWEYSLESLSTAGSWIRDRWSNVTTNFSTAGDWLRERWDSVTGSLSGIGDKIIDTFSGAVSIFHDVGDFIMRNWERIFNFFDSIKLPSFLSRDNEPSPEEIRVQQREEVLASTSLEDLERQKANTERMISFMQNEYDNIPRHRRLTAEATGTRWAIQGQKEELERINAAIERAGSVSVDDVPAFKDGGVHDGGFRIVGEAGPELEVTPPSSIVSNDGLNNKMDSILSMNRHLMSFDALQSVASLTLASTNRIFDVLESSHHIQRRMAENLSFINSYINEKRMFDKREFEMRNVRLNEEKENENIHLRLRTQIRDKIKELHGHFLDANKGVYVKMVDEDIIFDPSMHSLPSDGTGTVGGGSRGSRGNLSPSTSSFTPTGGGSREEMELAVIDELAKHGITSQRAIANVMGNIESESNFRPQSENMNYSPERLMEVFPRYFRDINDARSVVAQGQEAIGNRVYGRSNLGNAPNEGFKYRGRGLIQLTGKYNYKKYGDMIGVDLVGDPDLANDPEIAARIAAVYIADRSSNPEDIRNVNRAVGYVGSGQGGAADRKRITSAERYMQRLQSGSFDEARARLEANKTESVEGGVPELLAAPKPPSDENMVTEVASLAPNIPLLNIEREQSTVPLAPVTTDAELTPVNTTAQSTPSERPSVSQTPSFTPTPSVSQTPSFTPAPSAPQPLPIQRVESNVDLGGANAPIMQLVEQLTILNNNISNLGGSLLNPLGDLNNRANSLLGNLTSAPQNLLNNLQGSTQGLLGGLNDQANNLMSTPQNLMGGFQRVVDEGESNVSNMFSSMGTQIDPNRLFADLGDFSGKIERVMDESGTSVQNMMTPNIITPPAQSPPMGSARPPGNSAAAPGLKAPMAVRINESSITRVFDNIFSTNLF